MKKVCMFLMEVLCVLALPLCIVFASCARQAPQPDFLAEGQAFPFTKITVLEEYSASAEEYASHMAQVIRYADEYLYPDTLNANAVVPDSAFQLWQVETGRETGGGEHRYGVQFTVLAWVSNQYYAVCDIASPGFYPLAESLHFDEEDFVVSSDEILHVPAYKSQTVAVGFSVIAYEEGMGANKTYYPIEENIRLYCPF